MDWPEGVAKESARLRLLRFTWDVSLSLTTWFETWAAYREVVCALAVSFSAVDIGCVGRPPGACVVAANGVFDFDYVCAGSS